MNEFIEKNRRLLRFYCETLKTIGSTILILGLFGGCGMIIFSLLPKLGYWHATKPFNKVIVTWLPSYLKAIFVWIGIVGLPQFIRYLAERDYKPSWMLRHGDMFFYVYALLTILSVVWAYTIGMGDHSESMHKGVSVIIAVFVTSVKVLALVGLGRIFRHLMPIIEESKTLV